MTTILLMLGALVVVFVVAALATRESAAMAPVEGDRPDVVLRDGARGEDVRAVRFPLAVRGYRMRDVDAVLERLASELDERDARIAALEGRDEAPAPTVTAQFVDPEVVEAEVVEDDRVAAADPTAHVDGDRALPGGSTAVTASPGDAR